MKENDEEWLLRAYIEKHVKLNFNIRSRIAKTEEFKFLTLAKSTLYEQYNRNNRTLVTVQSKSVF